MLAAGEFRVMFTKTHFFLHVLPQAHPAAIVDNSLALFPYISISVTTWWPLFLGILELLVQKNHQRDAWGLFLSQCSYHESFGVGNKITSPGKIMENNGAHFHLSNQGAIKCWISNIKIMIKESMFRIVQNVLDLQVS